MPPGRTRGPRPCAAPSDRPGKRRITTVFFSSFASCKGDMVRVGRREFRLTSLTRASMMHRDDPPCSVSDDRRQSVSTYRQPYAFRSIMDNGQMHLMPGSSATSS